MTVFTVLLGVPVLVLKPDLRRQSDFVVFGAIGPRIVSGVLLAVLFAWRAGAGLVVGFLIEARHLLNLASSSVVGARKGLVRYREQLEISLLRF